MGAALDHYEEVVGDTIPDKLPMPLQVHRRAGRALPPLRHHASRRSTSRTTCSATAREEQTGGRVLKDRRLSRLLK